MPSAKSQLPEAGGDDDNYCGDDLDKIGMLKKHFVVWLTGKIVVALLPAGNMWRHFQIARNDISPDLPLKVFQDNSRKQVNWNFYGKCNTWFCTRIWRKCKFQGLCIELRSEFCVVGQSLTKYFETNLLTQVKWTFTESSTTDFAPYSSAGDKYFWKGN